MLAGTQPKSALAAVWSSASQAQWSSEMSKLRTDIGTPLKDDDDEEDLTYLPEEGDHDPLLDKLTRMSARRTEGPQRRRR